MRKLILNLCIILGMFGSLASAQTTAVSATITDSDSQVWTNARYNITFVPNPSFPNLDLYTLNGVPLTSPTYSSYLTQNVMANGSGAMSATVLDNTLITPGGSTWKFTVQSNTSAQATTYPNVVISGGSQNLTTFLSTNSIVPRFPAIPSAFGYGDFEVSVIPQPGGAYWNTTSIVQRVWTGSTWVNGTGGSGGGISGTVATNIVTKGISANTIGSSQITDDGTNPVISPDGFSVFTGGGYDYAVANDGSTGTTVQTLSCDNGSGGAVVCPHGTSVTNVPIGFTVSGAGTTGNSTQCNLGWCQVKFDNQTTARDYAIASTTLDGYLHDSGATLTPGQSNFFIWSANTGANTVGLVRMLIADDYNNASPTAVYKLQVNGTGLTAGDTVNFNATTPALPSNGYVVTLATSKSGTTDSISAALIGDGVSGHFLNGQGLFSTPPGAISGLTTNFMTKAGSATTVLNSLCDEGQTTTNVMTCTDTAGIAAVKYGTTDAVDNGSVQLGNGSGGDSTCPAPAAGSTFLCNKSNVLNSSQNGGAYAPLGGSSGVAWSAITNAAAALTLANAGFASTFNQTSAVNWTWANTTAATVSVAQQSPIFNLCGQAWYASANTQDCATIQNVTVNGLNTQPIITIADSPASNKPPIVSLNGMWFQYTAAQGSESIGTIGSGVAGGMGYSALGNYNLAVGPYALANHTFGSANVAVGFEALLNSAGSGDANNTAVGAFALENSSNPTSTFGSDAFGYTALAAATTGGPNSAFGNQTLRNTSTGSYNVGFGYAAGSGNTTGSNNVFIGDNTFPLGTLTAVNNSVFVGEGTTSSTNSLTNMLVLGYNAQGTASNQVTVGNSSITSYVFGGTTVYPTVRGTLTMTTATSDVATVTGATSSSVCNFAPTNSTAAASSTVLAYISAVSANSVTISHAATVANGGTLNILCTIN